MSSIDFPFVFVSRTVINCWPTLICIATFIGSSSRPIGSWKKIRHDYGEIIRLAGRLPRHCDVWGLGCLAGLWQDPGRLRRPMWPPLRRAVRRQLRYVGTSEELGGLPRGFWLLLCLQRLLPGGLFAVWGFTNQCCQSSMREKLHWLSISLLFRLNLYLLVLWKSLKTVRKTGSDIKPVSFLIHVAAHVPLINDSLWWENMAHVLPCFKMFHPPS